METEQKYDSAADTLLHIKRVNELLMKACRILMQRAAVHDDSKLRYPEKEIFDIHTPKLKDLTFGTEEYKEYLETHLKPALEHHYACNPHHPEHYDDGIAGMNLFDLIEMFFDWKAASERQNDGNIMRSLDKVKDKYGVNEQLASIMKNTAKYMGW